MAIAKRAKSVAGRVTARGYVSKRVRPGKRKVSAAEAAELESVYTSYRQDVLREEPPGEENLAKSRRQPA